MSGRETALATERERLVEEIQAEIRATAAQTGIERLGTRVLDALRRVPRHRFVAAGLESVAYVNAPLSIGHGQTVSQPYIVALMTALAGLERGARVLEIGTGSGYQAAVLAEIAREVYSIERVEDLAETAARRLGALGYANVQVRCGDGFAGWPEQAPFDAILVTAATDAPPPPLLAQLRPGGRLVIPLGEAGDGQELTVVTREPGGGFASRSALAVRFVPFVRDASA